MISKDHFKSVMRHHAASVVIIAAEAQNRIHGMAATSFVSVSADPALVLFCINRASTTHELLHVGKVAGISVLAESQEEFSQRFAARNKTENTLGELKFARTPQNAPLVPDACAAMEIVICEQHRAGDHSIFIGEVTWAEASGREPLVYHRGNYARLSKECDRQTPIAAE